MSYTFRIGEATLEDADLADEDPNYALEPWIVVQEIALPDAPNFPGDLMTANTNSRSPSYIGWHDFCRAEGLFELFFTAEGHLKGGHPGAVRLTQRYLIAVDEAVGRHKALNPTTQTPGWCQCRTCDPFNGGLSTPHTTTLDGNLARLLWLRWWIDWALKNCKIPTLWNI